MSQEALPQGVIRHDGSAVFDQGVEDFVRASGVLERLLAGLSALRCLTFVAALQGYRSKMLSSRKPEKCSLALLGPSYKGQ